MSKKKIVYDYSTKFDVSDIMKGLSQIQERMSQMTLQTKGKSLFGNVEKDFRQLNSLVNSFQSQLEKGITNPQEMKSFNKNLNDIQQKMIQVKNGLQQVASVSLDENAKKAAKEFKEMWKEVEKMRKTARQDLSDLVGKSSLTNRKDLQLEAQLGQLTRERLNEEIEGKKQALKDAQEQLKVEKQLAIETEKRAYINTQVRKKGLINKNAPNLEAFSLTASYKGTDASLREVGPNGDIRFNQDAAAKVINSEYSKALADIAAKGGKAEEVITKLTEALKQYGVIVNSDKIKGQVISDYSAVQNNLVGQTFTGAKAQNVKDTQRRIDVLQSNITQLNALTAGVNKYEQAIAAANNKERNFNAGLEESNREFQLLRTDAENMSGAINTFGNNTRQAAAQLQGAIDKQNDFNSSVERLNYTIKYVFSITNAWRLMRQTITKTYNDVKNLDKAFAQIAMVTNYSVQDMWNQYDNYAKMATELGQTTESVIQASGLYYQQGLDTAEALELTRDTMKLATLANLDFTEATSQMTAALRAFHMEMDEGAHVTDVYAEIAAHAAVDVNGLAQAMSATAAIANSSGVSFENATAMLATMVEATQEAPKNLGTAFKTVLARFTELKNAVDESETEFEDLDYNKVDKALKSVGITIKDANGQFRDMDDVLLELGSKWNDLSRNSQRYIATIAAGSRQQSRFIALMENYERTMELIDIAQESAGRSSKQFAKYEDTLEFSVNQLKEAWEQLRVSLMKKDFFNAIIKNFTGILSRIKNFDLKDIGLTAAWAITIGKNLALGIVAGIKASSGLIGNAITTVVGKATGIGYKTPQELDTARKNAQDKLQMLEANKVSRIAYNNTQFDRENELSLQRQSELQEKIKNLEYARQNNLVVINTETNEKLNLDEEIANLQREQQNLDNQIIATEQRRITANQQVNTEIERQRATLSQINKTRVITSVVGSMGQSLGTAIAMGMTGAFKTQDIAKTVGIQSLVSGVSQLLTGNIWGAVGSVLTWGISKIVGSVSERFQEWQEEKRIQKDAVYAIEKETENLEKQQEEVNKKLDEANSKYDKIKDDLDSITKSYQKYEELSQKDLLSEDEQEELVSSRKQLIELIPELVTGYNAEGEAILATGDAWDQIIERYKEAELQARKTADELLAMSDAAQLSLDTLEGKKEENEIKSFQKTAQRWKDYSSEDDAYGPLTYEGYIAEIFDDKSQYQDRGAQKKALEIWNQMGYFSIDTSLVDEEAKEELLKAIETAAEEYEEIGDLFVQEYIKQGTDDQANERKLKAIEESNKQRIKSNKEKLIQDNLNILKDELEEEEGFKGEANDVKRKFFADFLANTTLKEEDLDYDDTKYNPEEFQGLLIEKREEGLKQFKNTFAKLTDKQLKDMGDFIESLSALSVSEKQKQLDDLVNLYGFDSDIIGYLKSKMDASNANLEATIATLAKRGGINVNEIAPSLREAGEQITSAFATAVTEETEDPEKQAAIIRAGASLFRMGFSPEVINAALNSADWDNMSELVVDKVKNNLISTFKTLYDMTDSEAQSYAEHIITAFMDNQVFTTQIDSLDEINAAAQQAIADYDVLEQKASKLADYMSRTGDSVVLTGQETKELVKIFEDANKKLENTSIDYKKLFAIDKNGQSVFNLKAAREELDKITSEGKRQRAILDDLLYREDALDSEEKEQLATLKELVPELEAEEAAVRNVLGLQQDINTTLDKQLGKINALVSAYKEIGTSFASKGFADVSTVQGFVEALFEMDPNAKIQDYLTTSGVNQTAVSNLIESRIQELRNKEGLGSADRKYLVQLEMWKASLAEADGEIAKAAAQESELEKASRAVTDAYKDWQKAIEDVSEKQKELNETLHGTTEWLNNQEGLYNYTTNLERFTKAADDAKNALSDLTDTGSSAEQWDKYIANARSERALGQAEIDVYRQEIANAERELNEQFSKSIAEVNAKRAAEAQKLGQEYSPMSTNINMSDYITKVGDRYNYNANAINKLGISDEYKNYIVNITKQMNEYLDAIEKMEDQFNKREKEFLEMRKKSLQDMSSLETDMMNTLKEKYEQEIKDVEAKYSAMEEADNDYLDALSEAIEKQRRLRDEENKWNDLENKERKLALMRRDTSGSNQVAVRQLEQEVENDRQDLLDTSVDNIVNELKEIYELQKEQHEIEIEYKKALIDESVLVREMLEALDEIRSADDLINWYEDNTDLRNKTSEQIELMRMDWAEQWKARENFLTSGQIDFTNALHTTEQDVQNMLSTTSESLTGTAERTLAETEEKVDDNIKKAQQSLSDALQSMTDKERAYNEAIAANTAAQNEYTTGLSVLNNLLQALVNTDSGIVEKRRLNGSGNPAEIAEYNAIKARAANYSSKKEFMDTYSNYTNADEVWNAAHTTIKTLTPNNTANQAQYNALLSAAKTQTRKEFINNYNYANAEQIWEAANSNNNSIPIDILSTMIKAAQNSETNAALYYQLYGKYSNANEIWRTYHKATKAYASGGLVNYTGPAWVDGTPARPEAFLNPEDTERIGNAAKLLSNLPLLNRDFSTNSITNNTVGDTSININVNIENVSSDYDVDQAIERVKEDIVKAANYKGSNVILHKK